MAAGGATVCPGDPGRVDLMRPRIFRLLGDARYRERVARAIILLGRHPRGASYKLTALAENKAGHALRRIHNRQMVSCVLCGWSGNRFDTLATFGYLRRQAYCPACGSLERHRAMA